MSERLRHLRHILGDVLLSNPSPGVLAWMEEHPLADMDLGRLRSLIYECAYEISEDPDVQQCQVSVTMAAVAHGCRYLTYLVRMFHENSDPEFLCRVLNRQSSGLQLIRCLLPSREGGQPSPIEMVLDAMTVYSQSPGDVEDQTVFRVMKMACLKPEPPGRLFTRVMCSTIGETLTYTHAPLHVYYLVLSELWICCHGILCRDPWDTWFKEMALIAMVYPGDWPGIYHHYQHIILPREQSRREMMEKKRAASPDPMMDRYRSNREFWEWHVDQYVKSHDRHRQNIPDCWKVDHLPYEETIITTEQQQGRYEYYEASRLAKLTPEAVPIQPAAPEKPASTPVSSDPVRESPQQKKPRSTPVSQRTPREKAKSTPTAPSQKSLDTPPPPPSLLTPQTYEQPAMPQTTLPFVPSLVPHWQQPVPYAVPHPCQIPYSQGGRVAPPPAATQKPLTVRPRRRIVISETADG